MRNSSMPINYFFTVCHALTWKWSLSAFIINIIVNRLSTNSNCGLIIFIIWVWTCPFFYWKIIKWGKCDSYHFHPVFLLFVTKNIFHSFINTICMLILMFYSKSFIASHVRHSLVYLSAWWFSCLFWLVLVGSKSTAGRERFRADIKEHSPGSGEIRG